MGKKGKILKKFIDKEVKQALTEISSREYQKSVSATPSQKSRNAYKVIKKKLSEVDKILEFSNKLNEEIGGWKLNEEQLNFIREKINSIKEKSKFFNEEIDNNEVNAAALTIHNYAKQLVDKDPKKSASIGKLINQIINLL